MDQTELLNIVSLCLDEIEGLKKENRALRNMLTESSNKMIGIVNTLIKNAEESNHDIVKNARYLDRTIENLKYEICDPRFRKDSLFFPKICEIEKTIGMLATGGCSMARFGDGEFALMENQKRQSFQRLDEKLVERLREVILSEKEGMLIGIADNYGNLDKYNTYGKHGIRYYMTDEVRQSHAKYLAREREYHNAYISRPYALYADNMTDAPKKRFAALKQIWEKRNVIFVEGSLTRLGVGNDLFDNAAQIRRIEAPAENSFDKYDEILEVCLRHAMQDTLFLIALGPAAGVLAYDLHQAGYQAIDIGHMDLEYEWFLKGKGTRSEVKHKFNNEYQDGHIVEDVDDEEYFKQILETIN